MRRDIDRAILSELNSSALVDSEDQVVLIEELSSLNQRKLSEYLKIINHLTIIQLVVFNGFFLMSYYSILLLFLVILNLIANYYIFNYVYGKSAEHQLIIYGSYVNMVVLLALMVSMSKWVLVVPIVNYGQYFWLFYQFNLTNIDLGHLRLKTYKYKSV